MTFIDYNNIKDESQSADEKDTPGPSVKRTVFNSRQGHYINENSESNDNEVPETVVEGNVKMPTMTEIKNFYNMKTVYVKTHD